MKEQKNKNSSKAPMNKSTALQLVPKVKLGRSCSVCSRMDVKTINSAIGKGASFRAISRQIQGTDSMRDSIRRHAENCLKLDLHALREQKRIESAVEHYKELIEQLEFSKELQSAVKEMLTDSRTGEITLAPRDTEIEVLYQDYADLHPTTGLPKLKKAKLSDILLAIQEIRADVSITSVDVKNINYFDAAIKTIDAVDKILDKFAKVDGHYERD